MYRGRALRASIIHRHSRGLGTQKHALFFQASFFHLSDPEQHLPHRAILQLPWEMVIKPPVLGGRLGCVSCFPLASCCGNCRGEAGCTGLVARGQNTSSNSEWDRFIVKQHPMDFLPQTQTLMDEAPLAKVGARYSIYLIGFNLYCI